MLPEDNDAVCPSPSCSTCSRDEVSLPSAYLIIAVIADSGRICRQFLDVSSVNTTFPAPRGSAGLPYVVYYSSFTPRTFHLQTIEVDVALKVLNKQRNGYVNVSYVSLISKVPTQWCLSAAGSSIRHPLQVLHKTCFGHPLPWS